MTKFIINPANENEILSIDGVRSAEFVSKEDALDYMKELQNECIDFWENYVKKGEPPKNRLTF